MPISNSGSPPDQNHPYAAADLSDFFGGAWDFAPNGTFSDVTNSTTESPAPDIKVAVNEPVLKHRSPALCAPFDPPPAETNNNLSTKTKPPNLYEALQRTQMMAPMMMVMSPLAGYSEPQPAGMDWTLDSTGNIFPTSPTMMGIDQQQYNMLMMQAARLKRPRVSPFMNNTGLDFGLNMIRRPTKMPLSPISRPTDEKSLVDSTDSKTMPLVLPFAAATIKASKPTPVKLMPAKVSSEVKAPPLSLEDNIEKNLRSFLQDTSDLEWDNVTVVELKRILRQYELNATGKKAELMQRIRKIRASYRHLDTDSKTEIEENAKGGTTAKKAESSPDTMGSDSGFTETGNMGQSLDALFAGALELPQGSVLFS